MSQPIIRFPFWGLPVLIAFLVASLGWWGDQRLREVVEEEVRADLTSTLEANATALEIWAKDQANLATSLAEEPTFRALALEILENRGAAKSGDLNQYLRDRLESLGYKIAQLVDTNFMIVAGTGRGASRAEDGISEAHLAKFSQLFKSGRPVIITPFRPRHRAVRESLKQNGVADGQDNSSVRTNLSSDLGALRNRSVTNAPTREEVSLMQVAAPVRDRQGVVCGALALAIIPDQEFTRILSVARAGTSGATYVFDQNGLMLSKSLAGNRRRPFDLFARSGAEPSTSQTGLPDPGYVLAINSKPMEGLSTTQPLIKLVSNAVAGGSGVDVEPSLDYRGVPVVGAWRWLPRHGFGIATQLDAEEAFKPLHVLDLLFIVLFLALILCAATMFVFSWLGVIWKRRLGEAELRLRQLGQYRLLEKIGEGAMGTVYRAEHGLMRRETAIKLLVADESDLQTIRRFEREVQLTCQLTHPNTIQVYDYGRTPEGVFYYVMELLHGLNLHQLVLRFGPQSEGRVIYILNQVCGALAEAHSLGLVHRDIKPANIFVCNRAGMPDWVKVLDFGLVRGFRESRRQRQNSMKSGPKGTPMFMPPEAFRHAEQGDPRGDIYSLGALGYYLLTGQSVFSGESDVELYQKHLNERPVPPSHRTSNSVSAEIDEILLRCLEKELNLRFQSVVELGQVLSSLPQADVWDMHARSEWWAQATRRLGTESQRVSCGQENRSSATVKISPTDHVNISQLML